MLCSADFFFRRLAPKVEPLQYMMLRI